jgi:hypothetical protein
LWITVLAVEIVVSTASLLTEAGEDERREDMVEKATESVSLVMFFELFMTRSILETQLLISVRLELSSSELFVWVDEAKDSVDEVENFASLAAGDATDSAAGFCEDLSTCWWPGSSLL